MRTSGTSGMRTSTGARAGQYVALLAYLVFLAFPLVWLISTAFKSPRELGSLHPTWIPRHPTLANFRQAFDEQPLLHAALNSLLAALGAALIAVVIATPMAWVMARRRTVLARAATGWVVVSQAFPFVLVIIPLFLVLKNLRLIDSWPGWYWSTSCGRCRSRCGCSSGMYGRYHRSWRKRPRSTAPGGSARSCR